ncbi:MAG: TIGR02757 family protein [Synergistota bacterium]|nr:TIGR02757 family protein [Synergistota bacterium]
MLDSLYDRFNRRELAYPDPVVFLYRYPRMIDREAAALVASSLAYGRVAQIHASVARVLDPLYDEPARRMAAASRKDLRDLCRGFRHRFTGEEDLFGLLAGIGSAMRKEGSLQAVFKKGLKKTGGDTTGALVYLRNRLLEPVGQSKNTLLPDPQASSACKRLHLFLKWMVRSDDIDPGGWKCLEPSQLTVPMDVHMHRICACLGFTARKSADGASAREATESFKIICPEDPVKYDFALTRFGIRNDLCMDDLKKHLVDNTNLPVTI